MSIRVDFTNVENKFETIPEGNYEAVVFEVEQKVGKSSGKPYLNWQLKIQGGEYDGRRLFYMTSLSPNALWKLKENLAALGYTDEELAGDFELDTTDLLGRECVAIVKHEEYQGVARDKVDNIIPSGAGSTEDVSLYN
jgi:hypothetical protein